MLQTGFDRIRGGIVSIKKSNIHLANVNVILCTIECGTWIPGSTSIVGRRKVLVAELSTTTFDTEIPNKDREQVLRWYSSGKTQFKAAENADLEIRLETRFHF